MIYQKIGVYDTYFALIWVYQLITMPLLIWVVRGYFEDVSVEIEQAAKLDGYRWWEIFLKNTSSPNKTRTSILCIYLLLFLLGTVLHSHFY